MGVAYSSYGDGVYVQWEWGIVSMVMAYTSNESGI